MSKIKNIIFDFDGVILDSLPVKEMGFRESLSKYSQIQIDKLIEFHRNNLGVSRFVKFNYFFEKIIKKNICDNEIDQLCKNFSKIMVSYLVDKKYLVREVIDFIESNKDRYNMHIASGTEEKELNYLCNKLEIQHYFSSILGSPTPKTKLLNKIIQNNQYILAECLMIGDSACDKIAAVENGVQFFYYDKLSVNCLHEKLYKL